MPDRGKKRGLTPEQWADVRVRCEAGQSFRSVAEDVGIRHQTIMARAKREEWNIPVAVHRTAPSDRTEPPPPADKPGESNVVDATDRFLAGKTIEELQSSGALDAIVAEAANTVVITQQIKKTMAEAMKAYAEDLKAGRILASDIPGARDRSQVMKDSLGAWKLFQSMFREDGGLKVGQPTMPADKKDKVERIQFTVVREPTGTEG